MSKNGAVGYFRMPLLIISGTGRFQVHCATCVPMPRQRFKPWPMSFGAGTFLRKSQNSVGDDTRLGLQRIRSFSVSFGELSNLPIRMQTCLRKSCVTTFAKPNEFFKANASGKA